MRIVPPDSPLLAGRVAIASPVNRKKERRIFDDMEKSLSSCDCIWLDLGGNLFQPFRKKADLVELERRES